MDDLWLLSTSEGVNSMGPGKHLRHDGRFNTIGRRQKDDPDFKKGC